MLVFLIPIVIVVFVLLARHITDTLMYRPPKHSGIAGRPVEHMLQEKAPATAVFFFHGNASDTRYQPIADRLFETSQYDVYMPEYPGYNGIRFVRDTRAYLKRLLAPFFSNPARQYSKVIFVGQSLGTHFATFAATQFASPGDSLVLISPFESIHSLVGPVLGALVYLIGKDLDTGDLIYNRALPEDVPVTIIHGTDDEVIPFAHAKRLRDCGSKGRSITLFPQEGYHHNDLPPGRIVQYITRTSSGPADTA